MRFTDEELSRILGEHDAGNLIPGGSFNWGGAGPYPRGCVNQAAYNECSSIHAISTNEPAGEWFDNYYRSSMSPDELLQSLESL